MRKDVIKSLIAIKQSEIPFDVIERDIKLPINRNKIITVPGVRRCGKSTLMEIAINGLVREGVSPRNILWLGFDDERLKNMSSDDLDDVIVSYMEMFPDIPIKDVYMFFDEIQVRLCADIPWNTRPIRFRSMNIAVSRESPLIAIWNRTGQD